MIKKKKIKVLGILLFLLLISCGIKANQSDAQKTTNKVGENSLVPDITGEYELLEGSKFRFMKYMIIVAKDGLNNGDVIIFNSSTSKDVQPKDRRYRLQDTMYWEYDGNEFNLINSSGTKKVYIAELDKKNKSLILTKTYEGEKIGVGQYSLLENGTLAHR